MLLFLTPACPVLKWEPLHQHPGSEVFSLAGEHFKKLPTIHVSENSLLKRPESVVFSQSSNSGTFHHPRKQPHPHQQSLRIPRAPVPDNY